MDSSTPLELTVGPEEAQQRLEHFVRQRLPGLSRRSLQRLLESKQVLVDGRSAKKGLRLQAGQQVLVAGAAKDEHPLPQPELELPLLAVLPDLVAINKPAGLSCHPLTPGETDTVANALVARFPECAEASPLPREGGLVHRLDWSTSGVLLAARSPAAYGRLRGMFSAGRVHKTYLALVAGIVAAPNHVEVPLRTMPGDNRRAQAILGDGQVEGLPAATAYRPLQQLAGYTLIEARCSTGRRHQVRVHLAHAGHPLVGDLLYGGPSLAALKGDLPCGGPSLAALEGALLHASQLALEGGPTFAAPWPAERAALLRRLGAAI